MANNAHSTVGTDRRVLVFVPMEVGYFIDIVCKATATRKKAMMHQVFCAGIRSLFGVELADLSDVQLQVPVGFTSRENRVNGNALTPRMLRDLASRIMVSPE